MNKISILITLFLGLFLAKADAQSLGLLINLEHDGDLTLKWYPLSPELWSRWNQSGYTVERQQLDDAGNLMSGTQTEIARNILPKDSLWFAENAAEHDGYIGALGALMYDPDFQYPPNELLDADAVRYNFLVREAQYFDNIAAEALGLFVEDTTMVDGLKYRYTVSVIGAPSVEVSVDMDAESGIWRSSPIELNLEPPGGRTLSDMSGRFDSEPFDVVGLTAKSYGDSIVLRWGPNSADFWLRANESGYVVLKIIDENWGSIDTIAKVTPMPEADMEGKIEHDSFALMAAQMLYGNIRQQPEYMDDKAAWLQNRFGFSLFAAERSALAAEVLGLRFVDENVETGKKYTYFVESPASDFRFGAGEITLENTPPLPVAPLEFGTESGDSVIFLRWNKIENDLLFSSYVIERSSDGGKTFEKLTKRPTLFLDDEENPSDFYQYADSVKVNYKKFIYRLSGMTAFAEMSPSATAEGMGRDLTPPSIPLIDFGETSEALDSITVRWSIPAGLPDDFDKYQVWLSENFAMHDAVMLADNLPAQTGEYIHLINPDEPPVTPYFQVVALDTAGNEQGSFPRFVTYPDYVAPPPPDSLEGSIDEDGVVTLFWSHSDADDVRGYWILFSNDLNTEFVPVNDSIHKINAFTDTIALTSLSEKIYYTVVAEDDYYNRGAHADVLELARPDNVPPLPPFVYDPVVSDSAIMITWDAGGSDDVVGFELYKRNIGDENWTFLDSIKGKEQLEYADADYVTGDFFEYTMKAIDDAGLYSEFSFPVRASIKFDETSLAINDFEIVRNETQKSVTLQWAFEPPANLPEEATEYKFYVFKSYGSESVSQFRELESKQFSFTDKEIEPGALHNYAVKVVYDSGHSGVLTTVKSVIFE